MKAYRYLCIGLLAPLTAVALGFAQPAASVKVALLVGVNNYDKRGLADDPLQFAERDVEEMAKELKKSDYTVRLLTGSATGKNRATLANINSALDEALQGRNANDIILIGLAGHGNQKPVLINGVEKEEAFFIPVDGDKDDPKTMFALGGLIEKLDKKGGINLVLVDACRNDDTPGRGRGISGDKVTQLPPRTAILFSCSARQRAFETEKAGGGHGIFFHAVLEALRGKATTNDRGEVTWGRMAEYVQEKVPGYASDWIERARVSGQTPHEVKNLNLRQPPVLVSLRNVGEKQITLDLGGGVKMEFVRIEAGSFEMGAADGEKGYGDKESADERPRHGVRITKAFYMGKYEVTQEQYESLTGENPSWFSARGNGKDKVQGMDTRRFPVEQVSWDEATAFCQKLSAKQVGKSFRLPTEAEWEYACRAGTTTPFHFGSSLNGREANCDGDHAYGTSEKGPYLERTCRVGSYRPNAYGLYDMHGNVREWCADWYDKKYYARSPTDNPRCDDGEQEFRVLRGGSWDDRPVICRAASRYRVSAFTRDNVVGFRVVLRLD